MGEGFLKIAQAILGGCYVVVAPGEVKGRILRVLFSNLQRFLVTPQRRFTIVRVHQVLQDISVCQGVFGGWRLGSRPRWDVRSTGNRHHKNEDQRREQA